jgi:AAA family ATP:ADP antiporter
MAGRQDFSAVERILSCFTKVKPGEGRCVLLLCLQALALMAAYYLIRPVREALILTEGGAELRSYAVGIQAALLIAIIPVYGMLIRRVDASRVFQRACVFFACNLVILVLLGQSGFRLGFTFFIWASIFGVMVVTQFWAFASDLLNVASGQRLFGVIAIGLSCGAWIGARIASSAFEFLGPYGLMLASAAVLIGAAILSHSARSLVPKESRAEELPPQPTRTRSEQLLGGFALIGRSRYLVCIAALVMLLNWITSTGEFVLSDWLVETARREAPHAQAAFIGQFMGNYCATITLVGFVIQLLLVSRIVMIAGLMRALMVTPVAFLAGYLLIGIVPVFAIVQSVLIVQRSLDYSLLNTTRSALLLPTSREVKYHAKTAIDTFFYRAGDLLSTLSVFAVLKFIDGSRMQFVWLIIVLSATMTAVAWLIGRDYARHFGTEGERSASGALGTGGTRGGMLLQQ